MKRLSCLFASLLCAVVLHADEIQTKDGKKIEFKTLTDEGDYLELTTPQGTKVTVKKVDFDKYIPNGVKEVPLTGASFTFDKKRKLETVDLLARVDPKRDGITGTWKAAAGGVNGAGATNLIAKLQSAYTPAEEYDVTIVVEKKEGADGQPDGFCIGLIGGGKQFVFQCDALGFSGPGSIDGAGPHTSGNSIPGKFFAGKPRVVTIMVRREALIVQTEGKDFFTWKPDWSRVSLPPFLAMPAKNTLFLAAGSQTYQITRWTVTSPKEK